MMDSRFPIGSGGPSRKVKGVPLALLDSIDLVNVPSDLHTSINEFSSATGSNSPAGLGTTMAGASPDFVLNMPRSSRRRSSLAGFKNVLCNAVI